MPAEGGSPLRLTYNPGSAQAVCWTPDGRRAVYRSSPPLSHPKPTNPPRLHPRPFWFPFYRR